MAYTARVTPDNVDEGIASLITARAMSADRNGDTVAVPRGDTGTAESDVLVDDVRLIGAEEVEAFINKNVVTAAPAASADVQHALPLLGTVVLWRPVYAGEGATSAWVGASGRLVVVDVEAAVLEFGRIDHGPSSVLRSTFPRRSGTLEAGALAQTVISAMERVFAPDVVPAATPLRALKPDSAADKVLVSIVEFHDSVVADNAYVRAVDVEAVLAEASKLTTPWRSVLVAHGRHGLHDHKHVAMALQQALVAGSRMEAVTRTGDRAQSPEYTLVSRPYIDANLLRAALAEASDMLAGGLLENSPYHSILFESRGGEAKPHARVVPVYVFELARLPRGVLFGDGSRVVAFDDCVLVLAPQAETLLPLFDVSGVRTAVSRRVMRPVLAGIARAVAGLVPYTEAWSAARGKIETSYQWAVGGHAYGEFARGYESLGDADGVRGRVLMSEAMRHMDTAVWLYESVVDAAEEFARELMYNAAGDDLSHSHAATMLGERLFIDRLFHYRYAEVLVASSRVRETVAYLHDELAREEGAIRTALLAWMDGAPGYLELVVDARRRMDEFAARAASTLQQARADLECCEFVHETAPTNMTTISSTMPLMVAVMVAVMVVLVRQKELDVHRMQDRHDVLFARRARRARLSGPSRR
ncbi:uncharacterized protein AMSG_01960 [Thecamonas trahens ATCC 50062]|uniref:Uncharacterized protein n=1 Tax=Thecamonas trahens ATCC 50062 TaxID=461836 RepID=A0A0L0DUG2_THETB|nr:hypothetical protein AMSG_01960 [Thecamonas trahens ATCC 50062]KNC55691.1 hypothetical protein AMSG_01960 [Thecamonas trahens ATCC 50062]|eukprot:XP_013761458.1 hypothetical protein AMSG_01960 [Thecamonas trahens ATCC 50062]